MTMITGKVATCVIGDWEMIQFLVFELQCREWYSNAAT